MSGWQSSLHTALEIADATTRASGLGNYTPGVCNTVLSCIIFLWCMAALAARGHAIEGACDRWPYGAYLATDPYIPQSKRAEMLRIVEEVERERCKMMLPIVPGQSPFEAIRQTDEQGEFWTARQLMPLLEYTRWEDFDGAIDRAREDCERSGREVSEHFEVFRRSPKNLAKGGRPLKDYRLSRYACHLIVMASRTSGDVAAQARTYFSDMVDAAEDAALAEWQERAIRSYLAKGYSLEWAQLRIKDILKRNELTHEWQVRGIKDDEYAMLTDQLHMGTFGLSITEHKALKGFAITRRGKKLVYRDPLPPAMTAAELALNTFASIAAREIHVARDSQGYQEISRDVDQAAEIAADARRKLEAATGHPVASARNMVKAPDGGLLALLPDPDHLDEGDE